MNRRALGIVGTGALGGSIGLRARRGGALVVGYDANPSALAQAFERGAIDAAVTRDELYARAETVVLAAHLEGTLAEIERLTLIGGFGGSLIVDVASVKGPVVAAARGLRGFVATHPMAGSERSGAAASRAGLFEGRSWAYVPSGDDALDARACALIVSLGAVPLAVAAEMHDRIVAYTSHLPQLLASCYGARAGERQDAAFEALCGNVARELLRLSRSSFAMWRGILLANAANVEGDLRALAAALLQAADALRAGDAEALRDVFSGRTVI